MAEEIDRGSSDRQATWVAFKTLRQRPTVVGRTDDGVTVYEIRSVRLVFRPGASHFNRLVTCAKCGRQVPGSPVLAPSDLERPANPVFCDRCVRSPVPPRPEAPRETEDPRAPAAPPPPLAAMEGAVEAGRLAAVEAQLAEVRAEIRELGESNQALDDAQRAIDQRIVELTGWVAGRPVADPEAVAARDLADLRAGVTDMIDSTAQALHAALREGLDHLRAEIASVQQRVDEESAAGSEIGQHHHAEIEEKLARELVGVGTSLADALTQGLDHLRSEMASLQGRVDQAAARSEIEGVIEVNGELTQVQRDLGQKVSELAAQLAALPRTDPEATGDRGLADPRASMVDTIGVELAERLELLSTEIRLVEQRSQAELAAVAASLETQRKELTEALHDVAHETLMSVAEPLRDLTKAREDFERRLESLQRRTQEDQRRVEALNASTDAGASKLHALEQKIHASVQRLIHPAEAGSETRAVGPAPAVERRPPGALMESLERQLREAEERLGQL